MTFARRALLACAVAALPLSAMAESHGRDGDKVLATVNGEEVTLSDLVLLRATLNPQQVAGTPEEELYDNLLTQAVNQVLLRQAAERAGMQDRRAVSAWIEFQRDGILADVYANDRVGDLLSDEAIEAEYQTRFVEAVRPPEWNADHILVQDEEEAKALAERAKAGEDFGQLAKDNSKGPSAPTGGKLGWFRRGQLVPEFQQTVEGLEAGQVSDPVKTQFGWHVIKLNETRETPPPPLPSVRAQIVEFLTASITESVVDALRDAGDVTVEEGREGIERMGDISVVTED